MTTENTFPLTIEYLTEEDEKLLKSCFQVTRGYDPCYVGPKRYILTKTIKEQGPIFYNFEARPTDIWIFGYPRSGTNLTQEMVYLIATNFDYQSAYDTIMDFRFPLLEHSLYRNENNLSDYLKRAKNTSLSTAFIEKLTTPAYKYLENSKDNRFIKTHMPFSMFSPQLLTSGCKILYIARHPKDVVLSMYRFSIMEGDSIDFQTFWKFFKQNLIGYTPYFENLKEGWALRNNKNVLFLFYDEIVKDQRKTILRVSEFLGKNPTLDQIEKLEHHLNIKNFRNNKSVNNDFMVELGLYKKTEKCSFIWKGLEGSSEEYFDKDLQEDFDEWLGDNLKTTDLIFP